MRGLIFVIVPEIRAVLVLPYCIPGIFILVQLHGTFINIVIPIVNIVYTAFAVGLHITPIPLFLSVKCIDILQQPLLKRKLPWYNFYKFL